MCRVNFSRASRAVQPSFFYLKRRLVSLRAELSSFSSGCALPDPRFSSLKVSIYNMIIKGFAIQQVPPKGYIRNYDLDLLFFQLLLVEDPKKKVIKYY